MGTETNINPFGQSATVPDGYPIADNLTTNSAQKALSAKQGVKLREMCGIKSSMVINALGDSITEGWIGGGAGTSQNKWTKQMADNLFCTVNNYGVGGTGICYNATYEPFVTRLNSMAETNIDCLLIFGGTNDFGDKRAHSIGSINDTPALGDNFYASFKHLIEASVNKYPSAAIGIITPIRRSDINAAKPNQYGITLDMIVNAEIEVARYYSIPYLDFYHAGGLNPQINIHKTMYTSDGLHPNQAGINKWLAPQITKFAANLLAFKSKNT